MAWAPLTMAASFRLAGRRYGPSRAVDASYHDLCRPGRADGSGRDLGRPTTYASAMRRRPVAHRLPLTGVAVAGAVIGHMVAYVLAVPEPTVRGALLGATGHAYWTAAIAAAAVLGPASPAGALGGRCRAGLSAGRAQAGGRLGAVAGQLASFQVAIYLVQEALERLEAGI